MYTYEYHGHVFQGTSPASSETAAKHSATTSTTSCTTQSYYRLIRSQCYNHREIPQRNSWRSVYMHKGHGRYSLMVQWLHYGCLWVLIWWRWTSCCLLSMNLQNTGANNWTDISCLLHFCRFCRQSSSGICWLDQWFLHRLGLCSTQPYWLQWVCCIQ